VGSSLPRTVQGTCASGNLRSCLQEDNCCLEGDGVARTSHPPSPGIYPWVREGRGPPARSRQTPPGGSGRLEGSSPVPEDRRKDAVLIAILGGKHRIPGGILASTVYLPLSLQGSSASLEGLPQGLCTCRDPRKDPHKYTGIAASTMYLPRSLEGSAASLEGLSQGLCTCRDPWREALQSRGIAASTAYRLRIPLAFRPIPAVGSLRRWFFSGMSMSDTGRSVSGR